MSRRKDVCTRKTPFESREQAEARLAETLRPGEVERKHAYECGFCKNWHVGTRKPGKRRRRSLAFRLSQQKMKG